MHMKKKIHPRARKFFVADLQHVDARKNSFFRGCLFFAWAPWAGVASPEIIEYSRGQNRFVPWATLAKPLAHFMLAPISLGELMR